ncbi:MAG: TOBE domain-containing protein [Tibeticola sp.]
MATQSVNLTEALGHAASDRRLEVLRGIDASGSISSAARALGMSYKAAWQAVQTLSNLAGTPLVERTVGGSGGGGARLTEAARQLLALADALAAARAAVLARHGAGAALAGGLGLRTSMRNQLPCTVDVLEQGDARDPTVRVRLRTSAGASLRASITRESAELLGLAPGLPVLALCKATAVQVLAADTAAAGAAVAEDAATGWLVGEVEQVVAAAALDEVSLRLDGGGSWVGFAAHGEGLRPGIRARARVSASAVVIALLD